jgi:hypothetical protein
MLIPMDNEDSIFPHDRIVPQEIINFRVNGKFKNKIPGISEDNLKNGKPKIEVSGQLPPDTYDFRLKASPNTKSIPVISRLDDELDLSSTLPDFPSFQKEDKHPPIFTGVGVAEPVLDSELGKLGIFIYFKIISKIKSFILKYNYNPIEIYHCI